MKLHKISTVTGLLLAAALSLTSPPPAVSSLEDPAPAGFKVLYMFTGAWSVLGANGSAATSIHCTNFGAVTTMLRFEFFDPYGSQAAALQLVTDEGRTVTASTRDTTFYSDDAGAGIALLKRSVRVLSNGSTSIVCTGQILDPIHDPPTYIVTLPGFGKAGKIK